MYSDSVSNMVPSTSKMTCVTASLSITASTLPPAGCQQEERAEKFSYLLSVFHFVFSLFSLVSDKRERCEPQAGSEETKKLWRPGPEKEREQGRTNGLTEGLWGGGKLQKVITWPPGLPRPSRTFQSKLLEANLIIFYLFLFLPFGDGELSWWLLTLNFFHLKKKTFGTPLFAAEVTR